MPETARRIILLSEGGYQRLREAGDGRALESRASQSHHSALPKTSTPIPSPAKPSATPPPDDLSTKPDEGEGRRLEEEEEERGAGQREAPSHQSSSPPRPSTPPTSDTNSSPTRPLPPRFQKAAKQTLAQLALVPGLSWEEGGGGAVSVEGVRLEPFLSISSLLRAICVPFAKADVVPASLKSLLSLHGVRCRNHLLAASDRAKWHPFFTL